MCFTKIQLHHWHIKAASNKYFGSKTSYIFFRYFNYEIEFYIFKIKQFVVNI